MHGSKYFVLSLVVVLECATCIAQWKPLDAIRGLQFGSITATSSSVFATRYPGSGLYKYSLAERTWSLLNSSEYGSVVATKNVVFGSVGYHLQSISLRDGVTRDVDVRNQQVYAATVFGEEIIAATPTRLFHSTDDGASWNADSLLDIGKNYGTVSYVYKHYDTLIAGTNERIVISLDNGLSWRVSQLPSGSGSAKSVVVHGSHIFLCTNSGSLLHSNDLGLSWQIYLPDIVKVKAATIAYCDARLFCGTSDAGMYISIDDGEHWTQSNDGLSSTVVSLVVSSGAQIFASTATGVFQYDTTANSWLPVNNGLPFVSSLHTYINDDVVFASTSVGSFRSVDKGQHWTPLEVKKFDVYRSYGVIGVINNVCFANCSDLGLLRSTDNGENWTAISDLGNVIVRQILSFGSSILGLTTSGQLFLSSDMGMHWQPTAASSLPLNSNGVLSTFGTTLLYSPQNQFAFRSIDTAKTWVQIRQAGFEGFKFDHYYSNEQYLFGLCQFPYRSKDAGESWEQVDRLAWCAAVDGQPNTRTVLLITTSNGGQSNVYASANEGATWSDVSGNLPYGAYSSVTVSKSDVYVTTAYNGVWIRPLIELALDVNEDNSSIETPFQVLPQPVSDDAKLCFRQSENNYIKIVILDLMGREIKEVFSGMQPAGEVSMSLHTADLPDGVYTCAIVGSEVTRFTPMVVLR